MCREAPTLTHLGCLGVGEVVEGGIAEGERLLQRGDEFLLRGLGLLHVGGAFLAASLSADKVLGVNNHENTHSGLDQLTPGMRGDHSESGGP